MQAFTFVHLTLEQALKEYPGVMKLNAGSDSAMSASMRDENSGIPHRSVKVQLCLRGKRPIAWSWISPVRYRKDGDSERNLRLFSFMVYVHPSYRERGIASRLLQDAKIFSQKRHRRFVVHPWDVTSEILYGSIPKRNKVDYFYLLEDGIL